MKVLKFGCKSLVNGTVINNVIEIIKKANLSFKVFVVISARSHTINTLKEILEKASRGEDYKQKLDNLFEYQLEPVPDFNLEKEYDEIRRILDGVSLLGEYTLKIKDRLLAYGEVMSCKVIVSLLRREGVKARFVDARGLIKTDETYGGAKVLMEKSRENIKEFFYSSDRDTVEIITGAIASTESKHTTTLGRNGANYSASLIANFLEVSEVEDWTTVDGIYSADPWMVPDARIIRNLSFKEANELANFGTEVLNAKSIIPLIEKGIPIRILNILKPEDEGTVINEGIDEWGIKAVTAIEDVVLIAVEGRGILGKVGVAGRLFTALSSVNINVKMISLASSERGISFVIDSVDAERGISALEKEFSYELEFLDVSGITVNKEVGIVSIIGRSLNFFDKAYACLPQNNIHPYLIVNTINGENVSIVVPKRDLRKAVNVIHSQITNIPKKVNVVVFGVGDISDAFMEHFMETKEKMLEQRNIAINIVGIANHGKVLLSHEGICEDWKERMQTEGVSNYTFYDIYKYIYEYNLSNVVVVDNTDSKEIVDHYPEFVERRYDIVAANKNANITDYSFYRNLRYLLDQNRKNFYYATNIGAGLPLISALRIILLSGDKVKKIKGIFSGTLSYIFNKYSETDTSFTDLLKEAIDLGYTEADPREDLSGYDVTRKMVILAREIGLAVDMADAMLENLVPENLKEDMSIEDFLNRENEINEYFAEKKKELEEGEVLRYIGEISDKGKLKAGLKVVPKDSDLGEVKGADLVFEVFTELNGETPFVLRGTGVGDEIIAREVFSDLLRLADKI